MKWIATYGWYESQDAKSPKYRVEYFETDNVEQAYVIAKERTKDNEHLYEVRIRGQY